ncbi:hypothetical protein SDC9_106292 [bioreactor metagenome]|uniref:Amidohydrolase-related domain-containing protein n=1 Tax=bioreactor metagenome TaxID=1076179 RepID=A0A645B1Y1_9ZZZZ
MIIDNHNHLWIGVSTDGFLDECMSERRILEDMDAAGVDMSGVCTVAQSMNNDYVLECVKRHPDRLFGFCMVDPKTPNAPDVLRGYLDQGMKGLKLHPRLHGYLLGNHTLVDPLMEVCREYQVPMFSHGGSEEMNHAYYFEELARTFPDVAIIMGHMCMPNYCTDAKMIAKRNPNIYLDTSATPYLSVKTAVSMVGADRILMGSDWPGDSFKLSLLKAELAAQGSREAFELMTGGNIARLLNL